MKTLYGFDLSSPYLKVRYLANYLGIDLKLEQVDAINGEHHSDAYLQLNPVGKVPVLVDGDFKLFESNAIMRYLAREQGSDLYPSDIKQLAVVDQWLDFVSIHIGNAMNRVFGNRVIFPMVGIDVDERSINDGLSFLERFLPVINQQLTTHPYLAGSQLTLADFNLVALLDPAAMAGIDLSPYPRLQAHLGHLQQQAWYQQCHQFYGAGLQEAEPA